jgi:ring-1,2-phenylacetyl-CoA epoxidase subunit PaaA
VLKLSLKKEHQLLRGNNMQTYNQEDLKLFADIKSGKTFDATDPMPPIYRKHLLNLLWMQADSEYAGGLGYMPWIAKAPNSHERVLVAQIVKDEMRHAHVIYRILDDLGEKTQDYMTKQEFAWRIPDDLANIGFSRAKPDKRVNIFYYPITYWEDFCLFNFLMDRAAGHQLEDTLESSFLPWKNAIGAICKEEHMHLAHGDKTVKEMSADPQKRKFLQERLNLWWPRVMNVFGKSTGESNDIYLKLGLKKRTNAEVRKTFVEEIKSKCKEWGLVVPDYIEAEQPTQYQF